MMFDVKFLFVLITSYSSNIQASVDWSQFNRHPLEKEQDFIERIECKFCPSNNNCWRFKGEEFGIIYGFGKEQIVLKREQSHGGTCFFCQPCNRDDNCVKYGDCCANAFPHTSTGETCVPTNFKKPHSGKGFRAISSCPPKFTHSKYKSKCEGYDMDLRDAENSPPVLSDKHLLFRNKFCAICNNITKYTTWSPSIVCTREFVIPSSKSRQDVSDMIWSNDECWIGLNPDTINRPFTLRDCYPYDPASIVSDCNVTGHWKTYNREIEQACRTYNRVFVQRYRNVFCFICNTPDFHYGDGICEFHTVDRQVGGSFSAILNFRLDSLTDNTPTTSECSRGSEYDKSKNECREIHCTPGRWFTDGKCEKIINTRELMEYQRKTVYRVEPTLTWGPCSATLKLNPIWFLSKELRRQIGNINSLSFSKSIDILAEFSTTNTKCSGNDSTSSVNLTEETTVRIVKEKKLHGFKAIITYRMANGLTVESLREEVMNSSGVYRTNLPDFGEVIFTEVQHLPMDFKEANESNVRESYISIGRQYDDMYYRTISRRVTLNRLVFCPYVIVYRTDFEIHENDTSITLTASRRKVQQGHYEIINESTIYVCADTYFNITDKIDNDYKEEGWTAEGILSLVCTCLSVICLAVTFVIYCLLKSLRSIPGLNNMALSMTLMIAQLFFQFGSPQTSNVVLCEVIGGLTHYVWLAAVLWMNVCSLHMFRVFCLGNFRNTHSAMNKKVLVHYAVYCFCLPVILVGIHVGVAQFHSTEPAGSFGYSGHLCFINNKLFLGLTFALPIGLVILSNIVMFISVVIAINKQAQEGSFAAADRQYIHIYFRLSTITGAAWIFGFIHQMTAINVFAYLFIIFTGAQGVFIFFAFICNKNVLKRLRSQKHRKTKYTPVFTKSASGTESTSLTAN